MKSSSRSRSKPARPARIAVLGAAPPDAHFMSRLDDALRTSGHTPAIPVSAANMPAADHLDHDLTLLMGLEHGCDNLREADGAIRRELATLGVGYQVLYGTSDERLSQALRMVQDWLALQGNRRSTPPRQPTHGNGTWVWACDKCSDPQCEHRLLTDLLAQKPAQAIER